MKPALTMLNPSAWLIIVVLIPLLVAIVCSKREIVGPPKNLRCEYESNPLGIDVKKPRFTWQLNDSRRYAVQTAYQILVSTDKDKLIQSKGNIWDSGKIESDQSVLLEYAGQPLTSGTRYFWKVRTWDGDGKPTAYSDIAWWEMGLLKSSDWKAQWIGKPIPPKKDRKHNYGNWIWHPIEKQKEKPVYFRKSFDVDAKRSIADAYLDVAADDKFTAFVNGQKLGSEFERKRFFRYELKNVVNSGTNTIAILAADEYGEQRGLVFGLTVVYTDNTELVILSDESVKTSAKAVENWTATTFDAAAWSPAAIISKYGEGYWKHIANADDDRPRAILLRNEFELKKSIKRARAYVTGLGNYVLHINGQRVGNDLYTPGWTHYPKKLQYQTYDVTDLVKSGANAVGAVLGNMWWSSGLGWRGGKVYSEGPLRFFGQLVVEYRDGSSDIIASDQSWQTHDSPILHNSIYHGEVYDARLEIPGWDLPGFAAADWEPVTKLDSPTKKLVAQQGPPLRVMQVLKPVSITEPKPGVVVFDFGQNMVGRARLRTSGDAGTEIEMRFAELLHDDGTVAQENLRSARATDVYILKGKGVEIWRPNFTYHGFRYVQVTGLQDKPSKSTLTGEVIYSSAAMAGEFACSNDLLNSIQHNIQWGQRSNMYSVPTDCPQRDERLGWMGDAQIFAPTSIYNMNMAKFYSKWERDILDCQDSSGYVYDVNPAIVVSGPAKPGWGDAVVMIPWHIYRFYGDKRAIEENYDGMKAWIEYMRAKSINYRYRWAEKEEDWGGYGDWIAVEKSPSHPIAAAYYYYSTTLVAKMADVIGKTEDAKAYRDLAEKIAIAFNAKYFDAASNNYEGATQTANLLPLNFGLSPEEFKKGVVESIVANVKERDNHISTGFLGTGYLLPTLSDWGYHDLAYKVATKTDYPSWGYMVQKGATTMWELWNSDVEPPEGMNSRNHFCLAAVGEWYYNHLAGIRPVLAAPGYKQAVIAPMPVGDLTWAQASVQTEYGTLASHWKIEEGEFSLTVTVPANTTAEVRVPTLGNAKPTIEESDALVLSAGEKAADVAGVKFVGLENDAAVFKVGAGEYEFEMMIEK